MDLLPLVTGIVVAVFLLIYLFYSSITIKHAARFRYLSKRTVYLTVFFVSFSAILLTLALVVYAMILFN